MSEAPRAAHARDRQAPRATRDNPTVHRNPPAGRRVYRPGSEGLESTLRLRSLGLDTDDIDSLRNELGERVSLDQIVRLRGPGVDAEYISEMAKAGITASADRLAVLKSVGVDGEYVASRR